MTAPVSVAVELGERRYEILVGSGLLAEAGAHIGPLMRQKRAIVVTDETVAAHYLATLQAALGAAGIEQQAIVLPPGEQTKDFAHFQKLIEDILDVGIERGDTLIGLGGGVIGDLTGFAAAVLLRGIDFVQLPTTLLAQVDSAVGGKTGINTRHGKNLIGVFHQPRMVLADIDALGTLSRRQFLAGYAETVKYGLIGDAGFFDWLEGHANAICQGDIAARQEAVVRSCKAKAAIVAADERESGSRALLNLGHTFGHALEAAAGYGPDLLHGEAVAIGMCMAFDLSVRLGLCPADDAARLRRHIHGVGLPVDMRAHGTAGLNARTLISLMAHDKKVRDAKVAFVLARGIGKAFISTDVEPAAVEELLADALAA
jgi:3-dehydroquinate synthase